MIPPPFWPLGQLPKPTPWAPCLGSFLPVKPGRGLGQGQDRVVGGRSLWSQVPEPLAGLARTGPSTRGGKAASWLPL